MGAAENFLPQLYGSRRRDHRRPHAAGGMSTLSIM
jgi:hypothetical protein